MESDRVVRLIVAGRVQGVGFRAFVARRASAHGVGRWVRNRRDGTVEAVIAGSGDAVDAIIAEIKIGPPFGEVTSVQTQEVADTGECVRPDRGFSVLPTA
jgi:acylphosphatase